MEVKALAKLNLSLDVLGTRPDGYHDMKMVMQSITLSDDITVTDNDGQGIRVSSNVGFLPTNEKNLAVAATLRFYESLGREPRGVDLSLEKSIPVCAGMAGGSSDAAAVLRALNEMEGRPYDLMELAKVGEKVGSDVPYCVLGTTALAEGRGEVLTNLPTLPRCWVVVCKPDFPVSTPELFGRIDRCKVRCRPDTDGMIRALEQGDLEGVARRMYNVFEDVLPERQRSRVRDIKNVLIQCGALGANMSGTGPTAFGLFNDETAAREAYAQLKEQYQETYLAETV